MPTPSATVSRLPTHTEGAKDLFYQRQQRVSLDPVVRIDKSQIRSPCRLYARIPRRRYTCIFLFDHMDPACRGQGIATALMDQILLFARKDTDIK